MTEEKEVELSPEKVYALPPFSIVEYHEYYLAIFPNQAKWIVLDDPIQIEILHYINQKHPLSDILDTYCENEEDVVTILTQLEAKQIENQTVKSVFSNTRLHLHLTNRCNMKCPHCYMKSGTAYEDELSTDEIKELCRNFSDHGGTDVSLTGGEPSIHPDFWEIVRYISDLGMHVSIFTNGYSWTNEQIELLSTLDIEGVQISIDGFDEASNSAIRGKGAFTRALTTLDLLQNAGIFTKVAVTAPYNELKANPKKYYEFSKGLLNKYGEESFQINFSSSFMEGREISFDEAMLINKDYSSRVNELVQAIYPDITEDGFVFNIDDCVFDSCGFGSLNVMANGDYYFCDRIPDVHKNGNIRTTPYITILEQMKLAEEAGKIDHFKPCGSCELKYICGGGCRADHFRKFTQSDDFTNFDYESLKPRSCTSSDKEYFYELMIMTNERFFK